MVSSQFEAILKDLEPFFNCKLEPDRNNACLLKLNNAGGIEIQLELDRSGDYLLIGCRMPAVPPGRYRENVFREALKSNGLYPNLNALFGFSKKSDILILFALASIHDTNPEKIMNVIGPFITKARAWTESLSRGEVPAYSLTAVAGSKGGLFGLVR